MLLYRASKKLNKTELLRTHLCHHQAAKNTTADQDLSRIPTRTDHNFSRLTSRNIQAPCKIHRCSCTAYPKNEQNRTFTDTPLSPPGSKKHHRRPGFVSNPHPHRPQFFQTHLKEYPGTLQNTQVLLYSVSKKLTKQNFYGHTFVTTRQQKTQPQTTICLEPLPGIG